MVQTWFYQGWAGYRNEAARGGAMGPRRRVTHFPEQTKPEIAMPFG